MLTKERERKARQVVGRQVCRTVNQDKDLGFYGKFNRQLLRHFQAMC